VPLSIGDLKLPNNVFYSPLAGCSDLPFREMSAKYSPGLIYCEMVKMDALVRHDVNTFHILDYKEDMHPIGAQLCGEKPHLAGPAARIIEDLGFDVVDLNCGCPVDKVTKGGGGSGLLRFPERIGEILANMVAAVKIPVTVKIRSGWNDDEINAVEITRIAEAAGAELIAVHGRTREQGYRGPANWDHIKDSKEAANTIKVIGNGDVFSPEAAQKMFEHTGCDGVLVSRGTLGEPWIAEDICRYLRGDSSIPRDHGYRRAALIEHFHLLLDYYGERKAVIFARKIGCWYFKKESKTREFRKAVTKVKSSEEVFRVIDEFF